MTRQLALAVLGFAIAGCRSEHSEFESHPRMSMIGRDEAALNIQPSNGRGTFRAIREVDAENATLQLNVSNRCFDIQNPEGKRALLIVGPVNLSYTSDGIQKIEYPYKGRVGYDEGGSPEPTTDTGWTYIESVDMSGPFRPTIRTRRVVASSGGSSALIFSENNSQDIIINPGASGGVLNVEKIEDPDQSVALNPGEFVVFNRSFGVKQTLPTSPPGNGTDRYSARAYWLNEFATREIARTRPPQ